MMVSSPLRVTDPAPLLLLKLSVAEVPQAAAHKHLSRLVEHHLGSPTLIQNGTKRSSGLRDRMNSWSRKAGPAASESGLNDMADKGMRWSKLEAIGADS